MQLAVDEFGNPFVIVRDQGTKKRLTGIEAHKANIAAACAVANPLKSSYGPKGMDKIIVSCDGDVTVTNDGATILDKIEVEHQCGRLMVELSKSQDDEIGDGTTGVVILAGAMLTEALQLLDKGLHPLKIAEGFQTACQAALLHLETLAVKQDIRANREMVLRNAAMTAMGSKLVHSRKEQLADLCTEAVIAVADLDRKDVNFDLIKVESRAGGRLEDSELVHGIVIDKEMAHSQMRKEIHDAKVAILTCPFEPPKPKTKHKLDIKSAEDFKELQKVEQEYFKDMVRRVKESGANFVICQWGFDDEATHLLFQNDLPAVRWVGGVEIELIALATGGRIIPRFEEISPEKLGSAGLVREVSSGTEGDHYVVIEGCPSSKTVTFILRAGTSVACAEAKRSVHDALCAVRNLVKDSRVVAGGGAAEVACAVAVENIADTIGGVSQYAVRGFANALLQLPEALAANSGLDAIALIGELKAHHVQGLNPNFGIDCRVGKSSDMIGAGVCESYLSKASQISLATQVVRMILKIDEVIVPTEMR